MNDPAFASPPRCRIEPLQPRHDRSGFTCGLEPLDRYFAKQVTQDIRRRVTACFVAVDVASATVAGYYTIASSSLPLPDLAPAIAKKLPRYPLVPAVRIGRLAVATAHRRQGVGAGLLVDAITRALEADIAAFAMVVDAKDDDAVRFYAHHGFVGLQSTPTTLYFPLAGLDKLIDFKSK